MNRIKAFQFRHGIHTYGYLYRHTDLLIDHIVENSDTEKSNYDIDDCCDLLTAINEKEHDEAYN